MSNVTAIKPRPVATAVWMSPAEVCGAVPGMSIRKLQRFRDEGKGPRYSKLGRTVVYAQADVDAWVVGSVVGTRDQP